MEETEHKSFGVITISKIYGNETALFGSSIKHRNYIRVEVKNAKIERKYHSDYIHSVGIPILEFNLSLTQYAEMLAHLNQGTGTPITIKRIGKDEIEQCPFESKQDTFNKELKTTIKDTQIQSENMVAGISKILEKKSLGKKDKEEILTLISQLKMQIEQNLPYIQKTLAKQMDKTVLEAKGEIEGFIIEKAKLAGIGIKKDERPILLEEGKQTGEE